jgi:hypothetical protein
MGSTAHREGTKRNNKMSAHGRRKGIDIRNTHGGRNWARDRNGYIDSKGI